MIRQERLNDFQESLRIAFEEEMLKHYTAMPAIVISTDLENQTISAQIALSATVYDEQGNGAATRYPLLIYVPIIYPRGGGFAVTFPLVPGDEVLVLFASRCVDSWWQNGGVNEQMEFRINDLSDGFALPAPSSIPKKLSNVSPNSLQIRNNSGSTYVEITQDNKINCVAETEINLTAPTIRVNGQVISTGGMVIDGINFGTHKHTGVQTGSGNTGDPIP